MPDTPSYLAPPHKGVTYLTAEQVPTIVRVARDVEPEGMAAIFDETFTALVPALAEQGIEITGPAFSLHHRMPGATMTFEVGMPVATPLDGELEAGGITFVPSQLPAAEVATISRANGNSSRGHSIMTSGCRFSFGTFTIRKTPA